MKRNHILVFLLFVVFVSLVTPEDTILDDFSYHYIFNWLAKQALLDVTQGAEYFLTQEDYYYAFNPGFIEFCIYSMASDSSQRNPSLIQENVDWDFESLYGLGGEEVSLINTIKLDTIIPDDHFQNGNPIIRKVIWAALRDDQSIVCFVLYGDGYSYGKYALLEIDPDGVRTIHHQSFASMCAISNDRNKIVYSEIHNRNSRDFTRNIFIRDLNSGEIDTISLETSTAIWDLWFTEDDQHIGMVIETPFTVGGYLEILNLEGEEQLSFQVGRIDEPRFANSNRRILGHSISTDNPIIVTPIGLYHRNGFVALESICQGGRTHGLYTIFDHKPLLFIKQGSEGLLVNWETLESGELSPIAGVGRCLKIPGDTATIMTTHVLLGSISYEDQSIYCNY